MSAWNANANQALAVLSDVALNVLSAHPEQPHHPLREVVVTVDAGTMLTSAICHLAMVAMAMAMMSRAGVLGRAAIQYTVDETIRYTADGTIVVGTAAVETAVAVTAVHVSTAGVITVDVTTAGAITAGVTIARMILLGKTIR